MSELLDALGALCEDGAAREPGMAADLRRIRQALGGLTDLRPAASPPPKVVEAFLPGCLGLARAPLAARLVAALDAARADIAWYPSKSYENEPSMADFTPRYAVAPIVGPDRFGRQCPYFSDQIFLGVSLQAPATDYAAHAHRAVELYCILAGSVDWQQGDGAWRPKAPGDFMRHEAHEPHAMRTGEAPLLALFAWVSDVMSDVYLVDGR